MESPTGVGGRPLILRASSKRSTPSASEAPTLSFEQRFRLEANVHREGPVRISHVLERRTSRRLTLATCHLVGQDGWAAWDRFQRGCTILRSLRHRGVPKYIEQAERNSTSYLLMDRIPGQTLQRAIEDQRRFTDAMLLHILDRGLEVLEYLHDLNPPVYHGDIHPGSVFVSARGDVTLASFDHSVGRIFDRYDPLAHDWRVGYAAPELALEPPSPATDVYALGATLFAVACGRDASRLPVRGGLDVEACMKPGPLRDRLAPLVSPVAEIRLDAARHARVRR